MKDHLISCASTLAFALAGPGLVGVAHAQTESHGVAAATRDSSTLPEIVVTAQRREQQLQRVPITIVAMAAKSMQAQGIETVADLAKTVPGLTITFQRGGLLPFLRGVGTDNAGAGEESSIATYVDGVYHPSMNGNFFSFNNIDRIEVLEGPQGTLFGRNASGGLIQVITKDPTDVPHLDAEIGYGNYGTATANFYVSGPIANHLSGNIAIYTIDQTRGWGTNISGIAGVDGDNVNYTRETDIRAKLKYDFNDVTTAILTAEYSYDTTDLGMARLALPGTVSIGHNPFVGTIYDSDSNRSPDGNWGQPWGLSLRVKHQFPWAELTSTTSYLSYRQYNPLDQDGTPLAVVDANLLEKNDSFQQEFLLNGTARRLDWTSGLYFFHDDAGFSEYDIRSSLVPSLNTNGYGIMKTDSYAAFAQGTYRVTDRASLTAGLRYTIDDRSIDGRTFAAPGNPFAVGTLLETTQATVPGGCYTPPPAITSGTRPPICNPGLQTVRDFSKLTWRFALNYQFTDAVMGYASASQGFKSGIFNTSNPYSAAVSPETLTSYEVGLKSELFDRTLRFDAAAFYYNYNNIQLQLSQAGTTLLLNAARGVVKGAEAEVVWAPVVPTGHLNISGNISVLDAHYTSFPNSPYYVPNPAGGYFLANSGAGAAYVPCPVGKTPNPVVGDGCNATGSELMRTPKWSSNLSIDYSLPVGPGTLGMNISWYHSDGFFWDPGNEFKQPPYNLLNAQMRYSPNDTWSFKVYARNITQTKYFVAVIPSTLGANSSPGAPETYGASIEYKF